MYIFRTCCSGSKIIASLGILFSEYLTFVVCNEQFPFGKIPQISSEKTQWLKRNILTLFAAGRIEGGVDLTSFFVVFLEERYFKFLHLTILHRKKLTVINDCHGKLIFNTCYINIIELKNKNQWNINHHDQCYSFY